MSPLPYLAVTVPNWLARQRPVEPSSEALVAVTTRAHEARLARSALTSLAEFDSIQKAHDALQHVRWCSFSLGAGFAFAVFPFTPGVYEYCRPSNNPGWLCGARVAAFCSAIEATLVGIAMARDMIRDRNYCESEASRLAVRVGFMCRGDREWPGELMSAYRQAKPETRERIKALLRRPIPLESA